MTKKLIAFTRGEKRPSAFASGTRATWVKEAHKKRAPTFGLPGPKFAPLGRMRDPSDLLESDADACDLRSIFCEVTASTKVLGSHSKGAGRHASAFALSPIRAVFLDSNRWVVELTVKGSNLHLAPQYSVRGDGQFDKPKLAAV